MQYPFDISMRLHEPTTAASTATGAGTVAAAALIFDTESASARWPMIAVINVNAIDFADTNETYTVEVQGSNAADFSTGVETLASKPILRAGRHILPFLNDQAGTTFRYLRCRHVLAGTTPSISYTCFMAPAVLV